jgi:hypothetical protein
MDFLKKNYEKLLLALVLLGLTAAVGFLLIFIPEKQKQLRDMRTEIINRKPAPLEPLDTQPEEAALLRRQTRYALDLTTKHRLFNPVLWQVTADGRYRKIESEEQMFPAGLRITSINPINSTVTFQSTNSIGWTMVVVNPIAPRLSDRRKTVQVRQDGVVGDLFILRRVEGSPDNVTALDLETKDTHEQFVLPTDPARPYVRVVGHTADLKYPPDTTWVGVRPGTVLHFEGADYIVIDVNENSVLISAKANNKRTTISFSRPSQ